MANNSFTAAYDAARKEQEKERQTPALLPEFFQPRALSLPTLEPEPTPQRADSHDVLHKIEAETGRNATKEYLTKPAAEHSQPADWRAELRDLWGMINPRALAEADRTARNMEAERHLDDYIDPEEAAAFGAFRPAMSAGEAISAGIGKITGSEDIQKRAKEMHAENESVFEAAKRDNPAAFAGGGMLSTILMLSGIGNGIGAIKGFSSLPALAQSIISGAGSFGGLAAIQGAGSVATGDTTPGEYLKNVGFAAAGGGLGGAMSTGVSMLGGKFLTTHGLTQNKLARTVVAGLSGTGFAAGNTGTRELEKYLDYPEGYKPDAWQIMQDLLVAFAFSALSYLTSAGPGAQQTAADKKYSSEYFKETMTEEEAQRAYRELAKLYHPDLHPGDAEAAAKMAQINADYEALQKIFAAAHISRAAEAYKTATTSATPAEAQAAAQEYAAELGYLQEISQSGVLASAEAAEAAQILAASQAAMAAAAVTGSTGNPPEPEWRGETPAVSMPEATGKITPAATGTPAQPTERFSFRDVPVPTYEELVQKPDVPVVDVRRERTGSFAAERDAFLKSDAAKQMYSAPIVNRDTGEGIFITPNTITHTFSNLGWEQIELAEHLPEIVESAVLTHAEPSRNAPGDHTTGVYTLFGAARTDEGVQPVKLTVKEYNIEGQDVPATVREYLGSGLQPETFASVYDGKVLVLEGIEKESPSSSAGAAEAITPSAELYPSGLSLAGPSGSATTDAAENAAVSYPSGPATISVKDLLSLVKGSGARYVPSQPAGTAAQIIPGQADMNTQNGGMTNGNEGNAGTLPALAGAEQATRGALYGGDAGRPGPQRPRERAERVPAEVRTAGRDTKRQRELGRQRQQAVIDEPTQSPEALGVPYGTAGQTLKRMPEWSWDEEIRGGIEWAQSQGIKEVVPVVGLLQIEKDGMTAMVSGVIDEQTGRLFARADSMESSFSEIIEHEVGHNKTTEASVRDFMERVKSQYKPEAWQRVYDAYKLKYADLTSDYAGMTEQEAELYVWEEILEDAYAGKDRYGVKASVYGAEADAALAAAPAEIAPEPETNAAGSGMQTGGNGIRGPPDRYIYAGRNANGADSESLAAAERLEMQGVDAEDIRQETGWFRGADGLWRYEIDDSGMKYRRQGDMAFMDDPEYREYLELWDKVLARAEGTEEETERLRELDKRFSHVGKLSATRLVNGSAKLRDIIQHDDLFRAYPQLRNTRVQFADLEEGTRGEFDRAHDIIRLSHELRAAPESTLIHEIQHAVQKAEGFARGSNTEYWTEQLEGGYDNRTPEEMREAERLLREYDVLQAKEPEFVRDMEALEATTPDVPRGKVDWDTLEQIEEDPAEWQEFDRRRDELAEKYGELNVWKFFDLSYQIKKHGVGSGKRNAYDMYRDTAGEIEARDAAARRNMTQEERKATKPETGGENAVVIRDLDDLLGFEKETSPLERKRRQLAEIEKRINSFDPFNASADDFRQKWKDQDKRARLLREIQMLENPEPEGAPPIETRNFKNWFGDWTKGEGSKVVDENGRPLVVYHGTGTSIEAFDPAFTGQGNDQYGSGFYFTTDKNTAESYTTATQGDQPKLGGSDDPNVIPAYLNIRNPIVVNAKETPNLFYYPITKTQAAKIIAGHPKIMDPEESPLGDFVEEYWEDGPKSWMINQLAREYDWTLGSLENDIFRDYPGEFRAAVKKATGRDGVQVNFPTGERHYVAWFPTQIKHATENNGAYSKKDDRIRFSVDNEQGEGYNSLMERDDVLLGDTDETFTETDRAVGFTYAIVPGDSLIISNDAHGNANPDYPKELQPRDRTRAASQDWINKTARKLQPRKLAESPTAQNGAPIIRGDGVVIGGNGRSRAILMAYDNGNGEAYEDFIREYGPRYGIDTANLPEKPVLVRIAQNVADWTELAEELNVSSTATYSATERAMSDARKMEGVLDLIVPNDDGDINTAANRAFIQAFIQSVVPENERGDMLDTDGLLSKKGLERAENAIFAYAYGDPTLMEKYSESLDNDMKNVTNALMQSAPAAVALQSGIRDGTLYDIPAVKTVLKALEIFSEAKRAKKTVEEQANQLSILEPEDQDAGELACFIDRNKRSAKQLRIAFNSLYEEIESYGDPNQESFFGGENHDIHGALEGAIKRYETATGREFGRPDYWGAGMDAGMGSEAGAEGPAAGSEPLDESTGGSGAADAGADGGGLPESEPAEVTLPTLEEAEAPAKTPKAPKEPKPRAERSPARRRPPEPIPSTLPESGIPEGYNSIEEFIASSTARAEAAKAERLRNVSKEDFVGTPALQKLGVKIENSVGIYEKLRQLMENDRAAKNIQRETHKAERRLAATDGERDFASGIAAGVYNASDIPASMNRDKVMELADYYWAEQAVAGDRIRQQREQIGRALEEKMAELFKDSDAFRPSKAIVLNYRTPERNMLHIFGDERGKAINEALFEPVAVNEAERFRFVNRMHDEVRKFAGEDGKLKKLTKEERALVQMLIEGKAAAEEVASMEMRGAIENVAQNIRNGADAGDSSKEFGLSREEEKLAVRYARWLETDEALHSGKVDAVKVENAAKKYSELFDLFYDAINDFLVAHGYEPIGFIKGYAPHIQPENNQNMLNKAFNALGINTDVTRLPTSIAGLTANYRPNKRWNPYFLSRTGDVTEYDIASAFESYVDYMSDVLYHTDDIMRVRQAAKYFRQTYAPEEIKNNISWANELRYGTTEQKANYLRDQGVIERATVLSPADINAQMDEYVEKLFGDITKTTKYSDLVTWLDNYANILAGKQSAADRSPESMWGREILTAGNKLMRVFAQANVAGNLSSMFNQTAQIPMIQAELGSRWTAAAITDIMTGKLRRGEWASQSDFLTGKKGIEYLVSTPAEMVVTAMFKPLEIMDTLVSTVAVRGKYLKELHAGKSPKEAMKAADKFGTAVMGSRMKGSKPLAFHSKNPIYQMVNIFQIEAFNSWEHIKEDLPRDFRTIEKEQGKAKAALALAGVIVKGLLLAFLMNRLAEKTYGGTPAPFDLLGLTANFIASGNGLTTNAYLETLIDNGWEKISGERLFGTEDHIGEEPFNYEQALSDLGYNISNDIPFLRNVAGLLGLGDQTLPMPDIYGGVKDLIESVGKNGVSWDSGKAALALLAQLIPGGRQLYKTAMGAETILRGGDFSGTYANEKLKYPTEGDFWSTVQSLMFGKYATEASDEYYASGKSALSVNQTRLWRSLTDGGADPREVYDAIQEYRTIANDDDLSSYEKGVQERDLIRGLDMTDAQKLEMYRELSNADSRAEKFQAIMDTGLSFAQVTSIYDKYAEIDADKEKKATEQATEFSKWVDRQGYNARQTEAIKEQLKFWNIIPADATRYEKLTDAGLEAEDAYTLTNELAGLTPEPGKDSVSDMQKYRVIDSSDLGDREKIAAIGSIMGTDMLTDSGNPSQYAKMLELLNDGVTLGQYLDLSEADAVDGYLRYETVNAGRDYGITPAAYIKFREIMPSYDADENNNYSQKEVQAALDSMSGSGGLALPSLGGTPSITLTNTQKAVLWQIANKSWKPGKNPYDATVGQWVYDAMHAEPESGDAPALSGGAGELPGLTLPSLTG